MHNIPLILYLSKNLNEYGQQTADRCTFTTLINANFPINQLAGHKANCKLQVTSLLKYHGSYKRTKLIHIVGNRRVTELYRGLVEVLENNDERTTRQAGGERGGDSGGCPYGFEFGSPSLFQLLSVLGHFSTFAVLPFLSLD